MMNTVPVTASILIIIGVGLALRGTLWRGEPIEPLVIDLPAYQVPTLRLTASVTWVRLKGFLQTAAGIIVVTVAAVWLLQSIPAQPGQGFGEVPVQDSVYGAVSSAVAPSFLSTTRVLYRLATVVIAPMKASAATAMFCW